MVVSFYLSLPIRLLFFFQIDTFTVSTTGGAVTATFLPKGASMFVYFNEKDGDNQTPARLDWDLLNNMGHIRTHWLPRAKVTTSKRSGSVRGPDEMDMLAFEKLVAHEIDLISHTNDY